MELFVVRHMEDGIVCAPFKLSASFNTINHSQIFHGTSATLHHTIYILHHTTILVHYTKARYSFTTPHYIYATPHYRFTTLHITTNYSRPHHTDTTLHHTTVRYFLYVLYSALLKHIAQLSAFSVVNLFLNFQKQK